MKYFLTFIILITMQVLLAQDRIGAGGGVWVCEDAKHLAYGIKFMDVFEAREEYRLQLPETKLDPLTYLQTQKDWIRSHMTAATKILTQIEYVENNVTWINEVINFIPDGANKIRPRESTCPQGTWQPVQLVNYTDDQRVLVRKEIYDSTLLSNLERTAVYLHEGLYAYLRAEFRDSNSVRARALTGYLLSDLPDDQKLVQMKKILSQDMPPPPPPELGWICGLKPDRDSALYTVTLKDKMQATQNVVAACKKGEDPLSGCFPGFPCNGNPGGGFPLGGAYPGFPDGGFGPGSNCKEDRVFCEQITSQDRRVKCQLNDFFDKKIADGWGRTRLEAQQETIRQCLVLKGDQHACYDADKLVCDQRVN